MSIEATIRKVVSVSKRIPGISIMSESIVRTVPGAGFNEHKTTIYDKLVEIRQSSGGPNPNQ